MSIACLQWRKLQFDVDNLRADYGKTNKEVAAKKKAGEDADALIAQAKVICPDAFNPFNNIRHPGRCNS